MFVKPVCFKREFISSVEILFVCCWFIFFPRSCFTFDNVGCGGDVTMIPFPLDSKESNIFLITKGLFSM